MPKPIQKTKQEIRRMPLSVQIDLQTFAEGEDLPKEIQIIPVGKWNHPAYGPIVITTEDIAEFKANFDRGVRKDIPITEGHDGFQETPAVGWFTELINRGGNGLYASVEWTSKGKTLLSDKAYKYFSPEFYSEYEDPETREIYENVLVGGALTNKPYFKELEAVILSEAIINKLKFNDMDLQELLKKKAEELSAEEKTFVKENKDQLTDDQKETFKTVIEDEKKEEPKKEEKEEPKEEDPKEPTKDDEPVEIDGNELKMNEKGQVIMSAEQAKVLMSKANAGYEASEKLHKAEVKSMSSKLLFSEQNSKGKILPKNEAKLFSFMLELTDKQRTVFSELVDSIPSSQLFDEKGSGEASEGSAVNELDSKAKKLMSEDKELKYSDAITLVFKENPALVKKHESELK